MISPTKISSPAIPTWKTVAAFAVLYLVWGSTFLAIRMGVLAVPPLLFAGVRFLTAGLLLCGWALLRRQRFPSGRQWASVALLATMIFLINYSLLFWAEQRVPSGKASVMMATIPSFTALAEIVILRTQRLTFRLVGALSIGLAGVAVLMSRTAALSGAPIDRRGAFALLGAAVFWSTASSLSRKLPLPESKIVSSATQMLLGGAFMLVAALAFGEVHGFDPYHLPRAAWLSMAYLIVFGSLLGFTCYVWLIDHQPPTRVGTYAYINPLVAVLLGYFVAGEPLGLRTALGTMLILVSVVVLTTLQRRKEGTGIRAQRSENQADP